MAQHNQIKTVVTLDRNTTLEFEGRRGTGRLTCSLKHVRKIDGATTETTEVPFTLTDETLRNLSNVLDTYR